MGEHIDRAVGIQQVGGRESTYLKIAQAFVRNQGGAVEQIRSHLEQADQEAAVRTAHSMKGGSGTIGAVELHRLSALLEQMLKDQVDGEELQQLMQQAGNELGAAVAEIGQMLEKQERHGSIAILTEVKQEAADLKGQLQALAEKIASYEMEATDEAEALLNQLEEGEVWQTLKQVHATLEQYDFDRALEQLQTVFQSDA